MPFTFDYTDEGVKRWLLTEDGVEATTDESYTPTMYVGDQVGDLYGRNGGVRPQPSDRPPGELPPALRDLRDFFASQDAIEELGVTTRKQTFRSDPRSVLRIEMRSLSDVRRVARRVHQFGDPGQYSCYNVDLTRELRYCLETGIDPTPNDNRSLRTLTLSIPRHETGVETLRGLELDGEDVADTIPDVVDGVQHRVEEREPDVLITNTAAIVPLLFEAAEIHGYGAYSLGREPGYEKLASESTYESYGSVGHSPARYSVPGRVIIDESNSFFYHESGLHGCLDLVERSGLPLQELGWASIGRVLTAMQIHEANARNVLVPWKARRPEFFKSASTLDDADRGGTTLAPAVGVHETVHELDFASLYPNIIRTQNISPETICCSCCGSDDVPVLGYAVCEQDGYLPDVLGPLIDARDDITDRIETASDDAERERLEAASSAIKWILVSCFGYQGFSNAKYGRIECHEAINAFAREILLTAKTVLEGGGWRVLHGIVDSIWVTPDPSRTQDPLAELAETITKEVDIRLEHESEFDWVAFCPRRNSEAGALTRYFGRRRGASLPNTGGLGEAIKTRGIELRQRSTPPWIRRLQRDALRAFDATRDPRAVCDVLQRYLTTLQSGEVDPDALVIDNRISKRPDEYQRKSLTALAAKRAERTGIGPSPGQTVRYVVVDETRSGIERMRLEHERPTTYDPTWYEKLATRAVESVVVPLGWQRIDIERYLSETTELTIDSYSQSVS
ncbi:type B DNA-directed DNA polymerase [Halorubrum trueperi]|uniref:DNA-directed DNA polymerase n=1 Tax=Halorubrum trueperi TaxID=2004704 RepID=A0ABD5UKH2_9EURY